MLYSFLEQSEPLEATATGEGMAYKPAKRPIVIAGGGEGGRRRDKCFRRYHHDSRPTTEQREDDRSSWGGTHTKRP